MQQQPEGWQWAEGEPWGAPELGHSRMTGVRSSAAATCRAAVGGGGTGGHRSKGSAA